MKYKILLLLLIILSFCVGCSVDGTEIHIDNNLYMKIYNPELVQNGTTIFYDHYDENNPRILEVSMSGEILLDLKLEGPFAEYTNPGGNVELLDNGNLLLMAPRYGVFEMTREGEVVWEYYDAKVSHDADKLDNGNVLIVYGAHDTVRDPQIKEVNLDGEIVWEWYAKDHLLPEYEGVFCDGWTHANAVHRFKNGNTAISLRNFNFVAELDKDGNIINRIGKGVVFSNHDPEFLEDERHMLVASQFPLSCYAETSNDFIAALEIDMDTDEIIWSYDKGDWQNSKIQLSRDVNRLPNGNTLIIGTTKVIEVSPENEIVWELYVDDPGFDKSKASANGFFKVERIVS